jgi:hypothetical protein
MMDLTDHDVAEFREIYRRETGKEITEAQAREYAERVLRLVAIVTSIRPPPPQPPA